MYNLMSSFIVHEYLYLVLLMLFNPRDAVELGMINKYILIIILNLLMSSFIFVFSLVDVWSRRRKRPFTCDQIVIIILMT